MACRLRFSKTFVTSWLPYSTALEGYKSFENLLTTLYLAGSNTFDAAWLTLSSSPDGDIAV